MGVQSGGRLTLNGMAWEHGFAPSVSYLFRSVAAVYGARAAGILLSGMGVDGAAELRTLRDAGAVTFAQDRESSVVYGMPGEAVRLGAARFVLPPQAIASKLIAVAAGS